MNMHEVMLKTSHDHPGVVSSMIAIGERAVLGEPRYNRAVTEMSLTAYFPPDMGIRRIRFTFKVDEELDTEWAVHERVTLALAKLPSVKRMLRDFRSRAGWHTLQYRPWRLALTHTLNAMMPSGANLYDDVMSVVNEQRRGGVPEELRRRHERAMALDAVRRAASRAHRFGATQLDIERAAASPAVMEVMEYPE